MKEYINRTLNDIPGYYGHVEDVDVALWRGAYGIDALELLKTNGDAKEPFFSSDRIEIALDWRALWERRLVTKISLFDPKLQFIQRATAKASQTRIDSSWQDQVKRLYPFEINRFIIMNGLVRYKDVTSDPKINIYFQDLDLRAENFSNAEKSALRLPSTVEASARLLDSGRTKLKIRLNPLSEPIEADVNASIRDLALRELNDFAKAYANFNFEKGRFEMALEVAATKTKYDGYVKTLAQGVDVVAWEKEREQGDSVGHLLWEGLVGGITEIFQNQKRDRFAARIPLSGSRDDLQIDTWKTAGSILKNAFIQALSPQLEDSVSIAGGKGEKPAEGTSSATTSKAGK